MSESYGHSLSQHEALVHEVGVSDRRSEQVIRVDSPQPRASADSSTKPGLVFFHSPASGRCRRVEGFLAQVLQQRRNHETFRIYRVDSEERPDLVQRFGVERVPSLFVVEGKIVRGRLEQPRGCREIQTFLAPWLQ